ncbi:MAG TPA: serine/threonine-protein kinase [Rudaea sp.]
MTSSVRFAEIKRLFEHVCDLPADEQHARLVEISADAAMVAEVEALLGAQTQSLKRAALPVNALLQSLPDTELAAGDRIGAWRLVRKLASGGMGSVYLAERADGHFEQQAAIKLLRGLPTAAALLHLASERQLLAGLSHPNIARLLDGGATPSGQPFLVMEYIEGVPIDEYCDEHRLDLRARLKLFQNVCRAVQFAHQRLIVHCDLKPSNILVRRDGAPVLLDFGIARALDRVSDASGDGERFFTPRYASPEQLRGAEISTASDVYSLGLMLFELLTGRKARLDAADHTVTQLGNGECRPSQFVSDADVRRRLRGDLDAIVLRATATEPAQRYASAEAFAADIGRHLERQPVLARPQTLRYRYGRLLQRRWPLFAAAALFALLAGVFTWRVVSERDRALAAEHEARVQAVTAQQVSDFLVSVFEVANPEKNQKRDITAVQVLDQGASRIDGELKEQPAVRARLLHVLGRAYSMLGRPKAAADLYERAAQLRTSAAVNDPLAAAESYSLLAVELTNHGHADQADAAAHKALELRAPRLPADDPKMADSWNTLALVRGDLGKYDEAQADFRKALAIREKQFGPESSEVAATLHNIGLTYAHSEHEKEAVDYLRRALALKRRYYGDDHPQVLITRQNLGQALASLGQTDEAIAHLRAVLDGEVKLEGEVNDDVATAHNNIGSALHDAGRLQEAAAEYRIAIDLRKRMDGGTASPTYAQPLNNLAYAYEDMGDYAQAEPLFRESLAVRRKALSADDLIVVRAEHNLARLLTSEGKLAEAKPLIDHALAVRDQRLPEDNPDRARSRMLQAEWLRRSGEPERSRAIVDALAAFPRLPPLAQAQRWRLSGWLAQARGDHAQALSDFENAQAAIEKVHGPTHPVTVEFAIDHAAALLALGRNDEGRNLLRRIRPVVEAAFYERSPQRQRLAALVRS